ncbi:MAG: hypothetical protein ABI988_09765, partial [Nitrospirota bacterium]
INYVAAIALRIDGCNILRVSLVYDRLGTNDPGLDSVADSVSGDHFTHSTLLRPDERAPGEYSDSFYNQSVAIQCRIATT